MEDGILTLGRIHHPVALGVVRSLLFIVLLVYLDGVIELGTSLLMLSSSVTVGTFFAIWLAGTRLLTRGFYLGFSAAVLGTAFMLSSVESLPLPGSLSVFSLYTVLSHTSLALIAFAIAALLTWSTLRVPHILSLEIAALITLFVSVLSAHRNYHLDLPKFVNQLAWDLGVDPLTVLVSLSALFSILFFGYLTIGHLSLKGVITRGARRTVLGGAAVVALLLLSFGISRVVYEYYAGAAGSRLMNGVGQEKAEGNSPLSFHSALGGTAQPAALVRLDGDYRKNPFSPMLYLREAALSSLKETDIVVAPYPFDRDIPSTGLLEAYHRDEDPLLKNREKVEYSVYVMADQKNVFAIDYPLSIKPLKSPNVRRFKSAYKAVSLAPTYTIEQLGGLEVGDPSWSPEMRSHYLETHHDNRYQQLANKIVGDAPSPILKAAKLVDYLSNESTYTLTPNHQIKPGDDPVAAYLFGDLRGYCVHFAHATVYMLRALGIPSRIGTGYLTDLSQAKDGHILLRMSDRHAWAEVYIQGLGWVPFDTHPTKVESHAETTVDAKVLEELMGMLQPDEEILPKDVAKDEQGLHEPTAWSIPDVRRGAWLLAVLLVLLVSAKLYLRLGWALTLSPNRRLRRSYTSLISKLMDLGYVRRNGETRSEFAERLRRELVLDGIALNKFLLLHYSRNGIGNITRPEVDDIRRRDMGGLSNVGWLRKLRALLSVRCVLNMFQGRAW